MPETVTRNLPVLALRGVTAFPGQTVSFDVEREISIYALDNAMENDRRLFLVTQREISTAEPMEDDLYSVGTVCHILQIIKTSDSSVRVLVEGEERARLLRLWQGKPFLQANVEILEEEFPGKITARVEAMLRRTYALFGEYKELVPQLSDDFIAAVLDCRDTGHLADLIAQNITLRHQDRQRVLEELRPNRRLQLVNDILTHEVDVLSLEMQMEQKVRQRVAQVQKDMILREQVKVLQHELGDDGDEELAEYTEKIQRAHLPEEVHKRLTKEVERLAKQPFGSAEASVIRNYLDVCLEMPWNKYTRERADVEQARKLLDRDHYGLETVKERILEFIAVHQLNPDAKGKILCLVGPPGVGKTSVAISVAKAMNRKLARLSLGGVRDEADIRGHRKTYIGAMPGRIIDAVIKSGSMNPIILLDEIDKIGNDIKGDPSSALLEALDPEQNNTFADHYIEFPVDLSKVLFITTANDTSTIAPPLFDRMEVIELGSYTATEKFRIAKDHLVKKEMTKHALCAREFKVTDGALEEIIAHYTREAGVRRLEKCIGTLCRKASVALESGAKSFRVNEKNLQDYLGVPKYTDDLIPGENQVGVVNGLAWTSVGGTMLPIEVSAFPGTGKVQITGNLGDVMTESVKTAVGFIRSRADTYGIDDQFYKNKDLHIHAPEAAIPKDGPSAGLAITTALVSELTGIPIRCDVAMTGEISLKGRALPIGGLKEKSMAAYKAGCSTVIIPAENSKDLQEIGEEVKAGVRFVPVDTFDQVLPIALEYMPTPTAREDKPAAVPVAKSKRADRPVAQ